jgi:hypothetical protein
VRIETLPLILGVLIAMLGIGIMFDAWTPDAVAVSQERRRRQRIERHRNGEAMIGLGVLALAAAFIGRDSWRYSILVVIIGAVFLIVGAALNGRYVRELFVNRGPMRRREQEEEPTVEPLRADGAVERERPVARAVAEESRPRSGWEGPERRKTPRVGERSFRRPKAADEPEPPNP